MAEAHPPKIDLTTTFGALNIAVILATFLLGILTLQIYLYFLNYPRDSPYLKTAVATLWFLDTLHSVGVAIMLYHYTVANYFNPAALKMNTWSFNFTTILSAWSTGIVQVYFARRTWILDTLSRKRILAYSISFLSLCQITFGTICGTKAWVQFHEFEQFHGTEPKTLVSFWLGSAALCDILITISLVTTLNHAKTGFQKTDGAIERIIKFSVNTGLLTCVIAIVALLCFALLDNLIHLIFNFMLAKLYTNTMLATLNSRRTVEGTLGIFKQGNAVSNSDSSGVRMGKIRAASYQAPRGKLDPSAMRADAISCNVTTHTIQHEDPADDPYATDIYLKPSKGNDQPHIHMDIRKVDPSELGLHAI